MTGEELFESRPATPGWRARWGALPGGVRRLIAVVVVLLLLGAGAVRLRDWAAERALSRRVVLAASLGVSSSSTSPPGGAVRYSVRVSNAGPRPVWVISVGGGTGRIRLSVAGADRRVDAGRVVSMPLSVLVTCGEPTPTAVDAVVHVRRQDGGRVAARVEVRSGMLLLDVAATLCDVRPELRGYELSGPIARVR